MLFLVLAAEGKTGLLFGAFIIGFGTQETIFNGSIHVTNANELNLSPFAHSVLLLPFRGQYRVLQRGIVFWVLCSMFLSKENGY